MGRSSLKQLVSFMTVYVSIALFFYKPNSFTAGVSKSIIFIEFTILAIIFRIYFRFLKDNAEVFEELASKISLEYKTKYDGFGPEMQNRAAGSEETPHLFNKTCCLKMNLLLRLSHASTAFDDSGNLMHDTSLFFVFANYSSQDNKSELSGAPITTDAAIERFN